MQSIAGFAYVYFGEDFCSGVPFSRVSGDSLIFGAAADHHPDVRDARWPSSTPRSRTRAGGNDDGTITNLATVGRAGRWWTWAGSRRPPRRSRDVPTEFQYVTEHADSPLQPPERHLVVHEPGPVVGLGSGRRRRDFPSSRRVDPRVPVDSLDDDGDGFADTGLDRIRRSPVHLLKYPDATASVAWPTASRRA